MAKQTVLNHSIDNHRSMTVQLVPARALIDTTKYVAHPSVQRGLVNQHVNAILSGQDNTTDSLRYTPWGVLLSCKQPDGIEYIFDGQHRLNAIRRLYSQQEAERFAQEEDVATYQAKEKELDALLASDPEANKALLRRQLGLSDNPPQPYQPDPNVETMLDSPVVVLSYEGNWTDTELKSLFCAANQGKRVQPNLISAFKPNNDALVQRLYELGWLGEGSFNLIEDKKGCNSAIYGVKDVVKAVETAGGIVEDVQHSTTAAFISYLQWFFEYVNTVNSQAVAELKESGLYNPATTKAYATSTLGGSVRTLLAVAQVFNCLDDSQHHPIAKPLASLVGSLLGTPGEVNKCVPVYSVAGGGKTKLDSATVVERTVFFWLLVRLAVDGKLNHTDERGNNHKLLTLPKRFAKFLEPEVISSYFPNGFKYDLVDGSGYDGSTNPVTLEDGIELLTSYLPTPKVKGYRAVKPITVTHDAPALDPQQELELQQLTIGAIDL